MKSDKIRLKTETLHMAEKIAGIEVEMAGEQADLAADLDLSGEPLPHLADGERPFPLKETLAFVFALAAFVKVLTELWDRFGYKKTSREDIENRFSELNLPPETKRQILENRDYIVAHLAERFPPNGDEG